MHLYVQTTAYSHIHKCTHSHMCITCANMHTFTHMRIQLHTHTDTLTHACMQSPKCTHSHTYTYTQSHVLPHFHCQDNYSAYLYNPLQLTQDFHTCYISSIGVNIICRISQMRRRRMVVRKCTCTRSGGGMSPNPRSAKNGLSRSLPSLGFRQVSQKP